MESHLTASCRRRALIKFWSLPKILPLWRSSYCPNVFLVPISMGEPLRPCRKKIVASASKNGQLQKMENMFLQQNPTSFKKYYVGSCRQLKRMSRSWSMCLLVLSLSVFIAPVCNVKVDDIWQYAGAHLLRQNQLLEVIKDRVLAQLAYKFPSQVMMECSYKFLFLSAFFRDIKYFFSCFH
jgi:hypothetical protein